MAKRIIVFLALAAFVADCRDLRDEGASEHSRSKRCPTCSGVPGGPPPLLPPPGPPLPPPPPPPPPPLPAMFRTQNWSGLTRSADGTQQGVFSGAAVAADSGSQEASQAFSLASSSTGAGDRLPGAGYGGHPTGFSGQSAMSQAQSASGQGAAFKKHGGEFDGQQKFGGSANFKEAHFDFHGGKQIEGHGGSIKGRGSESQRQTQGEFGRHGDFGAGQSSSSAQAQASGNFEHTQRHGGFNQGPELNSGAARHLQQQAEIAGNVQQSGSGSSSNAASSSGASGSALGSGYDVHGGSAAGAESGRETLHGALDLASQGLQSARETAQQPASGCSRCGKSNYALSNAKSHSGNAVALSIGG